jgi:hypothetical protein
MIGSKLERTVYSATAASKVSQFTFVCDNAIEAEETHEWIRGLDGVAEARMGIIREFILVSEWLDDEIERMLFKDRPAPRGSTKAAIARYQKSRLGRPNA